MTGLQTSFDAIGTRWRIDVLEPLSQAAWRALLAAIQTRIDAFDRSYSRFRSDSWVAAMARHGGDYELPEDGFALLSFYRILYELTEGKVTPLIGQTLADAGYDAQYSLRPQATLSTPPRWEDVLSFDASTITLKRPALLDFGAAGKGYLIDIIGGLIENAGVSSYLINAGGDIRHRATPSRLVDIGLENPFDSTEIVGIVPLGDKSLCASSGSKRRWAGYHHIIDPTTLTSPQDIVATWVVADDTMTADGLATALFFVVPETLRPAFSFSYARLAHDMQFTYAPDFPVQFVAVGQP